RRAEAARGGKGAERRRRGACQSVGGNGLLAAGEKGEGERRRIGQLLDLDLGAAHRLDQPGEGLVLGRPLLAQEIEAERRLGIVAGERLAGDERALPPNLVEALHIVADAAARLLGRAVEEGELDAAPLQRLVGGAVRRLIEERLRRGGLAHCYETLDAEG